MIESPPNIIIGKLNREFILPISGLPYLDKLGGNLAYAAGGYAIWGQSAGLAAALGEDYPPHWLTQLETLGFDVRGIAIRPESMELRTFYGYSEDRAAEMDNPLAHFVRWQLTFPVLCWVTNLPIQSPTAISALIRVRSNRGKFPPIISMPPGHWYVLWTSFHNP
jgi:hypothetical protein